jgi:hypothetical protein
MEVAIGPRRRAAGACPVGGDRGVNSLSLSNHSRREDFIRPIKFGVASRVLPSRAKISFASGIAHAANGGPTSAARMHRVTSVPLCSALST